MLSAEVSSVFDADWDIEVEAELEMEPMDDRNSLNLVLEGLWIGMEATLGRHLVTSFTHALRTSCESACDAKLRVRDEYRHRQR